MIPREYKEELPSITKKESTSQGQIIGVVPGEQGRPDAVIYPVTNDQTNGITTIYVPDPAGHLDGAGNPVPGSKSVAPTAEEQKTISNYVNTHGVPANIDRNKLTNPLPVEPVFKPTGNKVRIDDLPQGTDFAATRNRLLTLPNGTQVQIGDSSNEDVYVYNGGLVNDDLEYYTGYGGVTAGMADDARRRKAEQKNYSGPWSAKGSTSVRDLITTPAKQTETNNKNDNLVAAGIFGTPQKILISGKEYTDYLGGQKLVDFGNDVIDKIGLTTKTNIAMRPNDPAYTFGASATEAVLKGLAGGIPLTIGSGLLMGQQALEDYIGGNVGVKRVPGLSTPIVYPKGTVDTWTKMFTGETSTKEYDETIIAAGGEKVKQTTNVFDENNKLIDTYVEDVTANKGDVLQSHVKDTARTPGIPELIGGQFLDIGSGIASNPAAGIGTLAGTGLLLFGPGKIKGIKASRAGVLDNTEASLIKSFDKPIEQFTVKPSNNEGAFYHVVNTETGAKLPGQLSDLTGTKGISTNDLLFQREKLPVFDISRTTKTDVDLGFMETVKPVTRVTTKDFTEAQFGNIFEGSGKGLPKELTRKIDTSPKTSDEQFLDMGNPFDKERLGIKAVVSTDDAAVSIKGLQRHYTQDNYLAGGMADLMFKRTSKGDLDVLAPRPEIGVPVSKGMLSGLTNFNQSSSISNSLFSTNIKKDKRFPGLTAPFTGQLDINSTKQYERQQQDDLLRSITGQTTGTRQKQRQEQFTGQKTSYSQLSKAITGTGQIGKSRNAGYMKGIPGFGGSGGFKKLFGTGMSKQKYATGDITGLLYGKQQKKKKGKSKKNNMFRGLF